MAGDGGLLWSLGLQVNACQHTEHRRLQKFLAASNKPAGFVSISQLSPSMEPAVHGAAQLLHMLAAPHRSGVGKGLRPHSRAVWTPC